MEYVFEKYLMVKRQAERLAFNDYIRRGRVSQEVQEILHGLQQFWEDVKYDPNQPRVPAGSSDGGQWTSGEGNSTEITPLGQINDPPIKPSYLVENTIGFFLGGGAVTVAKRALSAYRLSRNTQKGFTEHGSLRSGQRAITDKQIKQAVRSAEKSGNVIEKIGRYGTLQKRYKGDNGVTVIIQIEGRNAGKVITLYRHQ
jgi:hypothetical protein